jgi:hypothetical protein
MKSIYKLYNYYLYYFLCLFPFLVVQLAYGAQEDRIVNPFIPSAHLFFVNRRGKEKIRPSLLRIHFLVYFRVLQQFRSFSGGDGIILLFYFIKISRNLRNML